ncbi:LOW QUALITY PROTEIN: uncharacterized protein C11orf16 homolog [Trichechus inunguis]
MVLVFSGGFFEALDSSTGPGMSLPKYCSMTTTLKAPCWDRAASPWDLSFTCPFALAPWLTRHNLLTRYVSYHPCLHIADPAWQEPGWQGRGRDAADTWVLARRDPDGFYYWAQIKPAPELERKRTLLVEFEVPPPPVTGTEQPAQQHSVALEEEVIQLSPPMAHSLRPGDKVLAPWEANGQRYGPGTVVLGLETRDPLKVSKDEEITIHFWNGKTAKVPLGGVRWVLPAIWKHPSPLLWAPCCSLLGPLTGCVTSGLPLGTMFLCPPCYPHACCQLLCQGCLCCCPLAGVTWWPLTQTSEVTARELPEPELKPTAPLLPLAGPKEEAAVHMPMDVSSSSSSSSEEEDLENDLEMGPPQRLMVNSTVNTDPNHPEKSPWQSGLCQLEWRYWRRNGPEPRPRKPGTRRCNISGKKKTTNN